MAAEIISKRCSQCKQIKPLSEFNKNRGNKDGIRGCCKSCQKAYQQQYRQTPKGKASHLKEVVKYQKTPNGKAVRRKADAKYYARNPNYVKAISAVSNAIAAGRMPRPNTRLCHYCPKPAQQYHHWHSYEPKFWLDVIPVCIKCHKKEHRKIA